ADAEDMVALRAYCTENLLVTSRKRRLLAAADSVRELRRGEGAKTPPDLLARLAGHLLDRVQPVLEGLEEEIDALEEERADGTQSMAEATKLAELRRCVIALKRHLSPQRDVLTKLASRRIEWLGSDAQLDFVQAADDATRYVEELEELRERTRVLQDEYSHQLNMQMNKRMFVFSVIAAIFLPLSLLTGLLGINVGGIPGAESPFSFWAVCGILVGVGALQIGFLRKIRWI
ncbi:MAG: CorA family divalent cation transporter, partial [Planctomycetota bacterium]